MEKEKPEAAGPGSYWSMAVSVAFGSFSSAFTAITGQTPTAYQNSEHAAVTAIPAYLAKLQTRPMRPAGRNVD